MNEKTLGWKDNKSEKVNMSAASYGKWEKMGFQSKLRGHRVQ